MAGSGRWKTLAWLGLPLAAVVYVLARGGAGHEAEFIKPLGGESFARAVGPDSGLVVVDFWAAWCGPCRVLKPGLDEVAGEYAGQVQVFSVDVDRHPELARTYRVEQIPFVMMFRDGEPVDAFAGVRKKAWLRDWFEQHVNRG